jgi:hypothetical protein
MLSYSSETGWVFEPFMGVLVILALAFQIYRNQARKRSLQQREDGTYIWVEWHGGVRTSDTDPSEPGGAWDDADGAGDGGGGD